MLKKRRRLADVPEDLVVRQLREVQQHQDDPEIKTQTETCSVANNNRR